METWIHQLTELAWIRGSSALLNWFILMKDGEINFTWIFIGGAASGGRQKSGAGQSSKGRMGKKGALSPPWKTRIPARLDCRRCVAEGHQTQSPSRLGDETSAQPLEVAFSPKVTGAGPGRERFHGGVGLGGNGVICLSDDSVCLLRSKVGKTPSREGAAGTGASFRASSLPLFGIWEACSLS